MKLQLLGLAAWIGLGAACDSAVREYGAGGSGSGGGDPTGSTSTSVSSGGGQGGHDPGLPCPASPPSPGDACPIEQLLCTYGNSPQPECRLSAICSNGTWVLDAPPCPVPPPGACTNDPPTVGEVCQFEGAVCSYGDGTLCECTSCGVGPCTPPPVWRCGSPAADCPTLAPNAGTACNADGQQCVYGNPCGFSGALAVCTGGMWIWESPVCPQ